MKLKPLTLISLLLLTSALTQASEEILTCEVTEPFLTYQFNPKLGTLTRTDSVTYPGVQVLSRDVKLVSKTNAQLDGKEGSQYQVVDTKTGKVYIDMKLDNQGSDGMSDLQFPFSAKIENWEGGCESTSTPARDPFTSIGKLKGLN